MYIYLVMYASDTDTKPAAFYFHGKYILIKNAERKKEREETHIKQYFKFLIINNDCFN